MHTWRWNLGLGLICAAASLITLIWWIPTDIETGVLYVERRDTMVGDAMAPTAAAVAVLLVSIGLMLTALFASRDSSQSPEPTIGVLSGNWINLASMATILAASLLTMIYAGPLLVQVMQAAGSDIKEYRLLTDTVPHKYTGFAIGGFILVFGLISWIEGRASWRAAATGVGAVLVLIAVYDIPFDTLLLPPNGSQ